MRVEEQLQERFKLSENAQDTRERQEAEAKQRGAEQELRASKEALDLAINGAQLGTFYCDMPLNHIVWNDTCMEHFFLPPGTKWISICFIPACIPMTANSTRQAVEKCFDDGIQYNVEYRTVAPDGRIRWLNAIGKTYYTETGEPLRFDGITIDITEQKTRERTLNFLVELNDATRQMQEPEAIMADVARMLGEFMGVSRCAYATVEADESHFTIYKDYTNGCASCAGNYRIEAFGPRAVGGTAATDKPMLFVTGSGKPQGKTTLPRFAPLTYRRLSVRR